MVIILSIYIFIIMYVVATRWRYLTPLFYFMALYFLLILVILEVVI